MNFKSLVLHKIFKDKYKIIKDEGGEYVTILMKNRFMIPILPMLEGDCGLEKSEYTKTGPAKNSSGRLGCIVVYKKRA